MSRLYVDPLTVIVWKWKEAFEYVNNLVHIDKTITAFINPSTNSEQETYVLSMEEYFTFLFHDEHKI